MKKLLITIIVLAAFQDKFDHKTQYSEGDELEVEKERADDLVSRGLARVKEVVPPKETKPSEKTAAPVTQELKEKAEDAAPPAGDNPEKKSDDEPRTEE